MNVINLFGLKIDGTGALKTIRDVTDAGVSMAQSGAKSAQLYADAFQEKLNRVARQYIPETMRAIDALSQRQRVLAALPSPQFISDAELANASRRYDELIGKTKALEAASGPAFTGLGRIRQGLTSLLASATDTPPVLDRIATSLGGMATGTGVMVGVLAALAAVSYAYQAITRDAREAAEQAEATRKEFDRIGHMDVKSQGEAASILYSGDPFSADPMARQKLVQLRAQAADLERRSHQTTIVGGAGGVERVLSEDAKKAAEDLKRLNIEIERRNTLLQSITGRGGTIERAGTAEAAANLPGFITDQLNEQKRRQEAADREAAQVQRQADQVANAQEKKKIATVESAAAMRIENDATRAMILAAREGKAAVDALTIAEAGNTAVREAALGSTAQTIGNVRREAEDRARLAIQTRDEADARKAADEATKKAQAEAVRAARQQLQELDHLFRSTFSSFFTSVFTQGKNVFQALFDSIRQGFIRLVSDMLAARLAEKIAGSALGGIVGSLVPGVAGAQGGAAAGAGNTNYLGGLGAQMAAGIGGSAIGGFGVGYGVGHASSSSLMGGLGGAASGAAIGTMLLPGIGTAVGALAGLAGGLLGFASAAKEAAKATSEAAHQVQLSVTALQAKAKGDTLAETIASINADRAAQAKAIEDAWSGGDANSDRVAWRTKQLAAMNAAEDALIAKAKEAQALTQKRAYEDLRVRDLASRGLSTEADALARQLAQQREMEQYVKDGADPATLALLQQVQAQEKLAAATTRATTSALNMVEGYNIVAEAFRFSGNTTGMVGAGGSGSTAPASFAAPTGPARGTPQPTAPVMMQPVVLEVDGKEVARIVKRVFIDDASRSGNGDAYNWGRGL